MEKINCNIIQDLLPLYIDGIASEDTRILVEEHMENCVSCRKIYEEIQNDLLFPVKASETEAEKKELRSFKKFLAKRRFYTISLSVMASLIFLIGVIAFMHKHITYINYEDAGITVFKETSDSVYYKTKIRGNYHWIPSYDAKTGEYTVHYEQSLWEKYIECILYPFDHVHCILKKDLTQEVYVDSDGTKTLIWEASDEEKENFLQRDQSQPLG